MVQNYCQLSEITLRSRTWSSRKKNDVNKELPLRARCEIPHKLRKPYLCHFSNLAVMINARSLHKGAQAANASLGDQRNTCTRGDSFVMLRYSVLLPPPNSMTEPLGGKFCGTEILHTFIFNHTLQVEKCEERCHPSTSGKCDGIVLFRRRDVPHLFWQECSEKLARFRLLSSTRQSVELPVTLINTLDDELITCSVYNKINGKKCIIEKNLVCYRQGCGVGSYFKRLRPTNSSR